MTYAQPPYPRPRALALAIFCSIALAACGGGGGGMVRSAPAPQSLPPPATPPPQARGNTTLCPAPVTTDCLVTLPPDSPDVLPSVDSNHALLLRSPGAELGLIFDSYRFGAGTTVESGVLNVGRGYDPRSNINSSNSGTVLQSDVMVSNGAFLLVSGTVRGHVQSQGSVALWNRIDGNLLNGGRLLVSGAVYGNAPTITGNLSQTGTGVFAFSLAPQDWDSPAPLRVSGRADLSGTLELRHHSEDGWGSYPLPAAGNHWLIHADGGVFGTFDRWTSPGLFIEGSLRYASNDVWFDLTRISVLSGASANGLGSALTLASAANLDRALAVADGFGGQSNAAQRTFLASAGKLLWMGDAVQATRAIDSLSGALHADALYATGNDMATRAMVGSHLDGLAREQVFGGWVLDDGRGAIAGVDQWLGPRLLSGVHASQRNTTDTASAAASDLGAGGYLRWVGDNGWYAGLDAGVAHRTLEVGRRIDFASSGQWLARSRRTMHAASASFEAGKRLPLLGGRLTPFVSGGFSTAQAAAASEQGSSGFELQLADAQLRGSRASAGLRFARHWQWGDARWLQLNAATGIDQSHWNGQQQAAFLGVPDTWFDLPASSTGRQRWASLGLQGGWGRGWTWNAARSAGRAFGSDQAWQLGLGRAW